MKSLYNKIYKAINEGIQKALLIDPLQNDDVSINYSYHKINNETNIQPLVDEAANNFINNSTIANYNKLLMMCKNNIYKYKIHAFWHFKIIFDKIQAVTDNIDITWIDTANAVTFIMEDGEELPLHKISSNNKKNIVFIKLKDDNGLDNLIIHKDFLISNDCLQWGDKRQEIRGTNTNINNNGYANTRDILNTVNNLIDYQAFEYCINIEKYHPDLYFLDYKAYLPAINEIHFLKNNEKYINYILAQIDNKQLNIINNLWSSSQYFSIYAYNLKSNGKTEYSSKNNLFQVFPFFHKN